MLIIISSSYHPAYILTGPLCGISTPPLPLVFFFSSSSSSLLLLSQPSFYLFLTLPLYILTKSNRPVRLTMESRSRDQFPGLFAMGSLGSR